MIPIVEHLPTKPKKVWIDLDNSPHVPFFAPIIEQLEKRGHSVYITARDCFQVRELANLLNVEHRMIGRHYGKHKLLKLAGLFIRSVQLAPLVLKEKPDVAVSHGSRTQIVVSKLLRVPTILIVDYEHTQKVFDPDWLMVPDLLAESVKPQKAQLLQYPGIKEDVYVPNFKPDPSIRESLRLRQNDLVVTLRPPATEAHYHNPESDMLFDAVVERLRNTPNAKVVLLPRNHAQEVKIRSKWSSLFESGMMLVPAHAVDGLNLIWFSDLVISGGGTMNREAAALGVPVYSIFRGKIGVIDRTLAKTGRLVLVERVSEVTTKIKLEHRNRPPKPGESNQVILDAIVQNIISVLGASAGFHQSMSPKLVRNHQ